MQVHVNWMCHHFSMLWKKLSPSDKWKRPTLSLWKGLTSLKNCSLFLQAESVLGNLEKEWPWLYVLYLFRVKRLSHKCDIVNENICRPSTNNAQFLNIYAARSIQQWPVQSPKAEDYEWADLMMRWATLQVQHIVMEESNDTTTLSPELLLLLLFNKSKQYFSMSKDGFTRTPFVQICYNILFVFVTDQRSILQPTEESGES